ncbi:MAG: hypothetical protein RIC93_11415 [Alphaproteobacteria bacterium]
MLLWSGLAVSANRVSAEELVEHQTNAALGAFFGVCLNTGFELSRVEELAERLDWKKIEAPELEIFVPDVEAEFLDYFGYALLTPDEPPLPVAAFFGTSADPDGKTQHCSMVFKDVLPSEFIEAFVQDTEARLVDSSGGYAGEFEFYSVADFPNDLVLIETQPRQRGLRITRLIRGKR